MLYNREECNRDKQQAGTAAMCRIFSRKRTKREQMRVPDCREAISPAQTRTPYQELRAIQSDRVGN
jgi:hypothetical protein